MYPGIGDIIALIRTDGVGPNVDSVREVDKRLRLCKNPQKLVGSKAYVTQKAEEEAAAETKRLRKAQQTAKSMETDDPFGDESTKIPTPVDDDDDD